MWVRGLLPAAEGVRGCVSEIDQCEVVAYNKIMRSLRVAVSAQGCATGLSAALLALMLASPGPCLMSQFSRVLHRQGELLEAADLCIPGSIAFTPLILMRA